MKLLPVFHLPWRTIQILINTVTIVLGFMTFLPLSYTTHYFKQQCVLYGQVRFKPKTPEGLYDVLVDLRQSVWGSSTTCNFVTFLSVIVSIHAFMWCWFLLLMKLQLKDEKREHTLLFPCFVLNALVLIPVFVSSSMLQAGLDIWCNSLTKQLYFTYNKKYTCAETQTLYWDILEKRRNFYTFLTVARMSSWLMMFSVLVQTLVSGYKIYVWILKSDDTPNIVTRQSKQIKYKNVISDDVIEDERIASSERLIVPVLPNNAQQKSEPLDSKSYSTGSVNYKFCHSVYHK